MGFICFKKIQWLKKRLKTLSFRTDRMSEYCEGSECVFSNKCAAGGFLCLKLGHLGRNLGIKTKRQEMSVDPKN